MPFRTFIYHTPEKWYCAASHNPTSYTFNPAPPEQSSDVAVRLLAQQIKLGKERVIASIDDGLIFFNHAGQPIPSGQVIWDELFESATELYVAIVPAWTGRSIAEECAVVGDNIEIALFGALAMARAVSHFHSPLPPPSHSNRKKFRMSY